MMMLKERILVISDIHANLTALETVLADAKDFSSVICLGDLAGYGPDINEVIEKIQSIDNLICVIGNHDAALIGRLDLGAFNSDAQLALKWQKEVITPENEEYLKSLPEKKIDGKVTIVHGSPRNPVWEYLLEPYSAAENLDYFETMLCFVGHSHQPICYLENQNKSYAEWVIPQSGLTYQLTRKTILNPGSVGQPRDHDPRASYAIFDPEKLTWMPRRVSYDISSVQQRIHEKGLPSRHAARLRDGW